MTSNPNAEALANLRAIVGRLSLSAGSLSILGAALDAKMSGKPLPPGLAPHADALVDALGAKTSLDAVPPEALKPLLAEIRFGMLHGASLLFEESRRGGWCSTNPQLLAAAGETSAGFIVPLSEQIVPSLAGLASRFERGGDVLDVGCGVAAMSIALARKWPALRVVGVDPWAPSIELARAGVRAAGLEHRIALRLGSAEDVADEKAFDLAWIPSPFIPPDAVTRILARTFHALRPGGWLLFATVNPGGDDLAAAFARFRTAILGGGVWTLGEVEALLRSDGFVNVRALPAPPGFPAAMVAGQRPE